MKPKQRLGETYSGTEKFVILIGLVLFISMTYAYITDFSFQRFFLKDHEDDFLSTPIGRVVSFEGTISRQRAREFEFKSISTNESLFPNDTLMTGPSSSLSIQLNDGQKFDLGANSLIKLTFDFDFSLMGVTQKAQVKIMPVAATKKFEAPKKILPATPPVKPIEAIIEQVKDSLVISDVEPSANTRFKFSPEEFASRKKTIKISFRISGGTKPKISVRLLNSDREIFTRPVEVNNSRVSISAALAYAGPHTWQVLDQGKRVLFQNRFEVDRSIPMIKALETIGTTNEVRGMATKKRFDGFILLWEPTAAIPQEGVYQVKIFKENSERPLFWDQTSATRLMVKGERLPASNMRFFYTVEKDLPNGFLAISNRQAMGFDFKAPNLVSPEQKGVFNPSRIQQAHGFIIFTWSKTNFTDGYLFELSKDAGFEKNLVRRNIPDNVISIPSPGEGVYFWRVKALSGQASGSFSAPREFSIVE